MIILITFFILILTMFIFIAFIRTTSTRRILQTQRSIQDKIGFFWVVAYHLTLSLFCWWLVPAFILEILLNRK